MDITEAISYVSYSADSINFKKEWLSSLVDDVMVMRMTSDVAESISAKKDINQKPIFEYDIVTEAGKSYRIYSL